MPVPLTSRQHSSVLGRRKNERPRPKARPRWTSRCDVEPAARDDVGLKSRGVPIMARQQSKEQKETIEPVMHEFKHGELRIRGTGPKVKNPKQAIAIALHEAGASNQESPKNNRENLRRTKAKVRRGGKAQAQAEGRSRTELYEEAKRRQIPGRSKMSKAELEHALQR